MGKIIDIEGLRGAGKSDLRPFIAPQLATLVTAAPSGDEWVHELKFDGYRMLCRLDRGVVRFVSRSEKDWTNKFPNLAAAAQVIPADTAMIDGEVVIFDRDGRSNFQKLQNAIHSSRATRFNFQAFDLLYLNGFDLTKVALEDRKRVLKSLFESIPSSNPLRYSDHIEGNGEIFFQRACQSGVEGIISKLRNSSYDSRRSRSWLKVKCAKRQEFVIAGFIESDKGLPGFGALVLGVYEDDQLVYAGRVGTGFTLKLREELRQRFDKLLTECSALKRVPKEPELRMAQWMKPKLVCEVMFIEWTSDGAIRHPSFQGLREDKHPREVQREHQLK
jgi:bifunctional non-homologous end joining protein LigD